MSKRKPLSQLHPTLYFVSVWLRRTKRHIEWKTDGKKYSKAIVKNILEFRIKKHHSLLLRKLGSTDMQLQINKVINLKIAVARLNGITIYPGETFSFCKLVGLPTQKKGYVLGMELSFGEAITGIGGGICQIANMLNWLVLHSELSITQKSQHSFDPFPDEGRVLPFGSGAAIFYNYIDYQFTNNTPHSYQLLLTVTDKNLEGELRCNTMPASSYHVIEKEHKFEKINADYFRRNEIWRQQINRSTGNIIEEKLMYKNHSRVVYNPNI